MLVSWFSLGREEAELEELYFSPLRPAELEAWHLSSCLLALWPLSCRHSSSGSAFRHQAAWRDLIHSLGLGEGMGKLERGTGYLEKGHREGGSRDSFHDVALILFVSGSQLHQGPPQGQRTAHEKQKGLQLS